MFNSASTKEHEYLSNYPAIINEFSLSTDTKLININREAIRLKEEPSVYGENPEGAPFSNNSLEKKHTLGKKNTVSELMINLAMMGNSSGGTQQSTANSRPISPPLTTTTSILQDRCVPGRVEAGATRGSFMLDLYYRLKMGGARLFDMLYLIKYIYEYKINTPDIVFRNIEDIVRCSTHFCEVPTDYETLESPGEPFSTISKEAPGHWFIRMQAEKEQLRREDIQEALRNDFGLSEDCLFLQAISKNEMVVTSLTLEDISQSVANELERYNSRTDKAEVSLTCHFNQRAEKLFSSIYYNSLSSFLQKLFRLIRDIELLLKELQSYLPNSSESTLNLESKDLDTRLANKYPRAADFNVSGHLPLLGPTIRPFQLEVNRLFARDKLKVPPVESSTPQTIYDKSADEQSRPLTGLYAQTMAKFRAATGKEPRDTKSQPPVSEGGYVSKKLRFARELKEIIEYEITMNGMRHTLEQRYRKQKQQEKRLASITDSEGAGGKVRTALTRFKFGAGSRRPVSRGQSASTEAEFSTGLGERHRSADAQKIYSPGRMSKREFQISTQSRSLMDRSGCSSNREEKREKARVFRPKRKVPRSVSSSLFDNQLSKEDQQRMQTDLDSFILSPF